MSLPTLSVHLLGGFQVFYGETALGDRFKPRLQALLAYLLLHRETALSRQQLAFHFWSDSTESQARANLRKSIYRLRRLFPEVDDYLELDGAAIGWRQGSPLQLDVTQFEERLQQAEATDDSQKAALLEESLEWYKGTLLPDIYDDWLLTWREQLRQRYLYALSLLAQQLQAQREYAAAIGTTRILLREEPLHEATYRRLMQLQAVSGDVAGALRTYHQCARQLDQELGVEPGEATKQSYHRLLNRREPLLSVPARHAPGQLPLVGRDAAWQQLLAAWRQAAAGHTQVVVLSGEAGIGKTRLAEELLSWIGRQGISSLSAACFATETLLPLYSVADWLRSEAGRRALPALASRWRSEVARIFPELLAADPALEMPQPMTELWQQQHFFMGLTEAVVAAGEPLLLFLDDLQWADADTLNWLLFLAQQKGGHRFLLVSTVRSEELTPGHTLLSWQQTLSRLLPVHQIVLERLAPADTATLASSMLGRSLSEESAVALYRETEGNPLFTVEMVRAGLERWERKLPEKVRSVIEVRLGKLSPPAQEVAALAAVISRRFAFSLLQSASPQSELELLDSLDELWQRQIIREQGEDGYQFSHDKIREVALGQLSPARRRWWHRRVAQALEQLSAGQMENASGQMAAHWEAAGEIEQAAAAYQLAGEKAEILYANDEALHAYQKALALLETHAAAGVRTQRAQLFSKLGKLLLLTGRKQEAQAAFLEALASMPPNLREEARLQRLLGDSLKAQDQDEGALAAYERAEAVLPPRDRLAPGPELTEWIELQFSRLWLFYGQGRLESMQAQLDDVRPIVEQHGTPEQRARYLYARVPPEVRRTRYAPPLDAALHYSEQALAASRETGRSALICGHQFGLGFIRLLCGEEEKAEEDLKTALEMAEQIGHESTRLVSLTYLSVLHRRRGARALAEAYARQSLSIARAGNSETYIAAAEANLAWVAWRSGNRDEAWRRGTLALDLWQGSAYPFQWLASWPLLDIAFARGKTEKALALAGALLAPAQQRLPAPVTLALESALQVETLPSAPPRVKVALSLARERRFL